MWNTLWVFLIFNESVKHSLELFQAQKRMQNTFCTFQVQYMKNKELKLKILDFHYLKTMKRLLNKPIQNQKKHSNLSSPNQKKLSHLYQLSILVLTLNGWLG